MATDSPGQALARRFYQRQVAPLLADVPHAAALLGAGSEVLGYDDEVSTDHDFGERVQVFLPGGYDQASVRASLPERYDVDVTTVEGFFARIVGFDPAGGVGLADWLLTPTQLLASVTAGPVFHDPAGELGGRRDALAWYPDDVWRYVLAAGWLRVGQEQAFVGRTGGTGDDLGSAILTARLARDLVRLAFLIERRWAPYGKWLGRAFADLPLAAEVGPPLRAALAATGWREREAAVCVAASTLVRATNRLGLAEPVDPAPLPFYDRDIRVVRAEALTESLTDAITDSQLRVLLTRLGHRAGTSVGRLPGAIDQAADSTDVLCHVDRCRAAAPALGLAGSSTESFGAPA